MLNAVYTHAVNPSQPLEAAKNSLFSPHIKRTISIWKGKLSEHWSFKDAIRRARAYVLIAVTFEMRTDGDATVQATAKHKMMFFTLSSESIKGNLITDGSGTSSEERKRALAYEKRSCDMFLTFQTMVLQFCTEPVAAKSHYEGHRQSKKRAHAHGTSSRWLSERTWERTQRW